MIQRPQKEEHGIAAVLEEGSLTKQAYFHNCTPLVVE
jgi:hypothetical protein